MKSLEELRNTTNLIIRKVGLDGGAGEVQYKKMVGSVIWSDGGGWDHVSVAPYKRSYTPTWEEMCKLKDMFFHDDEVVVQYHPAKSDYVNNINNCLHLWRPQFEAMPKPPAIMVGLRKGQTFRDVIEEIRKAEADGGDFVG